MARWFAFVAALLFPLGASAVTLEMLAGSAPQTAHAGAYFQNPIGVIVRDDAGAPIAGAHVIFWPHDYLPGDARVMFLGSAGNAISDANGVAVLVDGVVALEVAGEVLLRAEHAQATLVLPPLTIVGTPPAQIIPASGVNQTAYHDELFGEPFVTLVLDGEGLPVPYAYVNYFSSALGNFPATATWDGESYLWAMADANGFATPPRALAGPANGQGAAGACHATGGACATFYFTVVDPPPPPTATFFEAWIVPPLSMERGTTSSFPFDMIVRDQYGAPLAGVEVSFMAAMECGSFAGAATVTVLSGADGHAVSPLFTALSSERYCPVAVMIAGLGVAATYDIYEFSADHVVISVPASLNLIPLQPFDVRANFSADGVPIFPPPISVEVTAAPNGATATLQGDPLFLLSGTGVNLRFRANNKSGKYQIIVRRGPVQGVVQVDQHGK